MSNKTVRIGEVTHYFTDLEVGVVELKDSLEVGDRIRIKGPTTDFEQDVDSIQVDQESVEEASSGDSIGLKVKERVRETDAVYKIEEE